ncbi:s-adenosyl-l-methionine-dependent methyltransferase [Lucifera butyrica]|uniref:S-adenosyl-l-methionine-dependent methyltransferase n=1 Tax=Lucifera butyrica TaxID=1351585 RepID=A0A498RB81_9FIRM|nr:nickel-dependent lactate racemase [Lucifera butyrica]VBB08210.1 s-adenosyl-l-methionine-dependent methyltransferase [Lucifera butyrica]
MEYSLGFDKSTMNVTISDHNLLGVLRANKMEIELTGEEEVIRALKRPINAQRLRKIVKPGEKIAIITSDITRPMPSKTVLPPLLDELREAGVQDGDITVVFALGSHRRHTEEEKKYLVGDKVYERVHCVDGGVNGFRHFGHTADGTPVDICNIVADADRRICLGNIEYHYFAGYSGGAKAIMPGVSTRAAIQANHSRMVDERSHAGNLNTNPVRLDIDAVAKYISIDFILNVVLDEQKKIIKAVAGHYIDAHREGCQFLDRFYKIKIREKADVVITSSGGFPKDLNLYQAQKALDNAKHAVKKGGIIIFVASCREGFGEKTFEEWIVEAREPDELIDRIKKNFKLGGHKAAAIAMVMQNQKVYLVSDLDDFRVKNIFFEPFHDVQSALNHALEELGNEAKVILIPQGGSILPVVGDQ